MSHLKPKASLDWSNLRFEYEDVNCYVKSVWKDGSWGSMELVSSPYITMHVGATALNYGQTIFEGMKAFHCKDGKVLAGPCPYLKSDDSLKIPLSSLDSCVPSS